MISQICSNFLRIYCSPSQVTPINTIVDLLQVVSKHLSPSVLCPDSYAVDYKFKTFPNSHAQTTTYYLPPHVFASSSTLRPPCGYTNSIPMDPNSSVARRTAIIAGHLRRPSPSSASGLAAPLQPAACIHYTPPELSEKSPAFDPVSLRRVLDGHDLEARDWLFRVMEESPLFCPRRRGDRTFVAPDYNQSKEQQREVTMRRIEYLLRRGVFEGWLTGSGPEAEMRKLAFLECIGIYDHSLGIKLGVHFFLWGGAIQFLGTKRHHDKWLKATETYQVKGCFAMTELGHGSNVRGIETIATYDTNTGEFVINTPCESAQKYWIGGAANHATHTIIFSQLLINGTNQGVHAFIAQIRDADGNVCPNVRIADCGHKIGLNGVDNGRIWFDNLRVPRENLLNSVADVLPDGQYVSSIKNPDQRFAAFLAPLTSGRVNIAVKAVYISKVGLATAVRYALTRRAFSITANDPEVLLLDYPTHQRRLLPLIAKTCAMSSAANYLKRIYIDRTPEANKTIHIYSSALKATLTWHNMTVLQECREACGGQGLKTENRIGILKGEFDVHSTFEGDNNVLMQQVSKALLSEYIAAHKRKSPLKGLGLEHMNDPCPVIPANLTSCTLRSIKFQLDVFCLRERDLLRRYASEVSQYQVQGESKEKAVLLSYQLADELAKAFTQRTILQIFVGDEVAQPAGPLKDLMGLLRSMYALICVEEDASFLRYGYLSLDNAAAARKEVMKLCSDLRPHALSVVSSFGIPDAFLGPIAFDWIQANSWSSVSDE
ncbi:acyl-coenzyme A oxidase 3, peroxisomal [Canna indica]|uniref:Acyl-coenzyme A oxidase n=1 Tax=Canna indica TaxID=4628 RepID=A0AAQ3KQG0_9LILI|nr:acyl-coenzyme A oxidase 3, peroxisomal [Canna indica]